METLTSLPTGYVDESVPEVTLIALASHATTLVSVGEALALEESVGIALDDELALALEVLDELLDPPPRMAENTHHNNASTVKMMSTSARRRSQYTIGGSGPIGCMNELTSVTLPWRPMSVQRWYANHARDLPWRREGVTPWGVLVCEVMAQQTQAERVAPRWVEWMERWPEPARLLAASRADVLRAWSGLGYPRRAVRLHEAAGLIVAEHHGEVPNTYDELIALPGVGPYTANAVLVFAFGQRALMLDTNIRRVLRRAFNASNLDEIDAVWPTRAGAIWGGAIMELGALVCTARHPKCGECPLASTCHWLRAGQPAEPRQRTQPAFHGSHRQRRGAIMRALNDGPATKTTLMHVSDEAALDSLLADGLVVTHGRRYALPE